MFSGPGRYCRVHRRQQAKAWRAPGEPPAPEARTKSDPCTHTGGQVQRQLEVIRTSSLCDPSDSSGKSGRSGLLSVVWLRKRCRVSPPASGGADSGAVGRAFAAACRWGRASAKASRAVSVAVLGLNPFFPGLQVAASLCWLTMGFPEPQEPPRLPHFCLFSIHPLSHRVSVFCRSCSQQLSRT